MNARKRFAWRLASRKLPLGDRTLILGVVDVAPGSKYTDPAAAAARAFELEEQGAGMVAIASSAFQAGTPVISAEEESRRLIPVLKRLRGKLAAPLAVETFQSSIAARAFEFGAEAILDPSGLTFDPDLGKLVSQANAGLVLSHMRGTPETWARLAPLQDPATTVVAELDAAINRARRSTIAPEQIVIDPGFSLGKRKEDNLRLSAELGRLVRLELPILVGSWHASAAGFTTAAILQGAHIVRVSDVAAVVEACQLADGLMQIDQEIRDREAEAKEEKAERFRARDRLREVESAERRTPVRVSVLRPAAPLEEPPPPGDAPLEDVTDGTPPPVDQAAASEAGESAPPAESAPSSDALKPPAAPRPVRRPPEDKPRDGRAPYSPRPAARGDRDSAPRFSKPGGPRKFVPRDRDGEAGSDDRPRYGNPAGPRKFVPRDRDRPEGPDDRPRYGKPAGSRNFVPRDRDRPEGSEDRPRYGKSAGPRKFVPRDGEEGTSDRPAPRYGSRPGGGPKKFGSGGPKKFGPPRKFAGRRDDGPGEGRKFGSRDSAGDGPRKYTPRSRDGEGASSGPRPFRPRQDGDKPAPRFGGKPAPRKFGSGGPSRGKPGPKKFGGGGGKPRSGGGRPPRGD